MHGAWITGSVGQDSRKGDLGVFRIRAHNEEPAQIQGQFHRRRLGLHPAFEDGFRLVKSAHRAKQHPKLLKCGHERRLALDRALQARQRLAVAPRFQERLAQVSLDAGTAPFACGLLERRDRLARALLRQQGDAQEMRRIGAPAIPRQSLAGEALGVGRALLLERLDAELDDIVDRRRGAASRRFGRLFIRVDFPAVTAA